MTHYKNVMIYCETIGGKLDTIAKELLGCGKKLANDLGEQLCAVLMGNDVSCLANEAIAFGADRVCIVDDPLLKDYQTDCFVFSMVKVIELEMPRILIFGQTPVGQDLSPRLAFKLKTTVVLDCVELSIDSGSKLLLRTKPVYGGKAMANFISDYHPQLATIRPKSMQPLEKDNSRRGEIIHFDAGLNQALIRTKMLGKVFEKIEGVKLEDAEVIISGGRGIGSADGFKQLIELAKKIRGAAVGATRVACDSGWAPSTVQIGLTGKIVAPKVYIAVALSGTSQHMAGCCHSGTIVAINKDPKANIFKEARFGIVGDWKILFPALIKRIEELSGN